ncbi:MAG: hydroxymethylbilane synthase [Steroidobacter sp.]
MNYTIRIATRESRLALWQAEHVASALRAAYSDVEVSLVPMTTRGDQVLDRTLAQEGGKGLFIKELEVAMNEGRAEIAVHSMKDVPSVLPEGMVINCVLQRADPRDAFIANTYSSFASLPQGARVGTSSLRRQSQLLALRPDLLIGPVRGNVETRLRKLDEGEFDAIVLASAGLERLGLSGRITEYLEPEECVPAVGQGVIGIECRSNDYVTRAFCAVLNHADTETCVNAERAFAAKLEGGCQSPIAAYAVLHGDELQINAVIAATDGSHVMRDHIAGSRNEGVELGTSLAERMLEAGAGKLLNITRE